MPKSLIDRLLSLSPEAENGFIEIGAVIDTVNGYFADPDVVEGLARAICIDGREWDDPFLDAPSPATKETGRFHYIRKAKAVIASIMGDSK